MYPSEIFIPLLNFKSRDDMERKGYSLLFDDYLQGYRLVTNKDNLRLLVDTTNKIVYELSYKQAFELLALEIKFRLPKAIDQSFLDALEQK